jgi:hypothetical protein
MATPNQLEVLEHLAESCTLKGTALKDTKTFVNLIKVAVLKHIPRGLANFYRPFWRLDELQTERNKRRKASEANTLAAKQRG